LGAPFPDRHPIDNLKTMDADSIFALASYQALLARAYKAYGRLIFSRWRTDLPADIFIEDRREN